MLCAESDVVREHRCWRAHQEELLRPVRARVPCREDVLVERGVQGGVPDTVPLQVSDVVLLPQPRPLLQRLLLYDWHRLHMDPAPLRLDWPLILQPTIRAYFNELIPIPD